MKKQLTYANTKGIAYVAIIGESELEKGVVTLKDMAGGCQCELTPDALVAQLKKQC